MESELTGEGAYVRVDNQMTFPNPVSDQAANLEWKLRYAPESITRGEQLYAASIVSAYKEIVAAKTQKDRNQCCAAIQAAYKET